MNNWEPWESRIIGWEQPIIDEKSDLRPQDSSIWQHSLSPAESNLKNILSFDDEYWKKFEFSISFYWNFELIEISWEKLWAKNWVVDREFFYSDKWKNLKSEMEEKWYSQPSTYAMNVFGNHLWWVKELDTTMWGCLKDPWVWLDFDERSNSRPFIIDDDRYKNFKNWIGVDGWIDLWGDRLYEREETANDFPNMYRDHVWAKVVFFKRKEEINETILSEADAYYLEEYEKALDFYNTDRGGDDPKNYDMERARENDEYSAIWDALDAVRNKYWLTIAREIKNRYWRSTHSWWFEIDDVIEWRYKKKRPRIPVKKDPQK